MKRRWLIRSFFIGLILLCGAGWWASYSYNSMFYYTTQHQDLYVAPFDGSLIAYWNTTTFDIGGTSGFHFETDTAFLLENLNGFPHALGFYGGTFTFPDYQYWLVGVPFWFLTLLFAGITFWVWRKTRRKPNPATAFPVEMDKLKS